MQPLKNNTAVTEANYESLVQLFAQAVACVVAYTVVCAVACAVAFAVACIVARQLNPVLN